jgi:chromosome segregation ATPase
MPNNVRPLSSSVGGHARATTSSHHPTPSPPSNLKSPNALRSTMASLPPHLVVREVIAYLASCSSISGSPLTILQREYLQFVDSAQILSSRGPMSSSATHARASKLLRGDAGSNQQQQQETEAVYVMSESTTSLRDVHTEYSTLQEAYRKIALEANFKDRRIATLQTEIAKCQYNLQVLRSGITSSHVVHASTVDDAQLLHAAQELNVQLAEQLASFEDNFDVFNFVEVRELLNAVGDLTKEKEILIYKSSLLSEKLIEGGAIITDLQQQLCEATSSLEDLKSTMITRDREIALLRDELSHAMQNFR